MNVEEHLRRVLADERFALPAWQDPAERVGRGIRRRRLQRSAVAAAAAAVVLGGVLVPSWAGRRSRSPVGNGDQPVPWLSISAPATPTPGLRRDPRPDARDCTAADLGRRAWVEPGAGIQLVNISDSRCTLRGSPGVVATEPATGRRTTLDVHTVSAGIPAGAQFPATIDPGEAATTDFGHPAGCASPAGIVRYRDPALVVLGREVPVSGQEELHVCPTLIVFPWSVMAPLLHVPFQVASIQAPATVRRGQTLDYIVTILNASGTAYRLNPCPAYTQRLGEGATTFGLNCAVSEIPPHRSVRFQMRLAVAADAPLGETRLTWMAVAGDGRVIIADLATGGVPITVTQ
ncbi:MAG TPA: hypothetical protein VFB74_17980 [Kribbellaceae bacterium]|nr:hypothetical protein [Kribbellaceae bacterium]